MFHHVQWTQTQSGACLLALAFILIIPLPSFMLDTIPRVIRHVAIYHESLVISFVFAILAFLITLKTIPRFKQPFLNARLSGIDVLKLNKPVLPETLGLPVAIIYLIAMFLFMPIPFLSWFGTNNMVTLVHEESPHLGTFPYHKLGEILSAILAIQSMVLLGFADDVLDVRWRYKVWFPAIAGIPLLIFYYTNFGVTYVVTPIQLRSWLGDIVHLGPLYYVYMVSLIIFCTHSINILAGINGIEAGQSLVIALSIIVNDLLFIYNNTDQASVEVHLFSLYFMLPFAGITAALLYYNWYPAQVFVGDTFCYFAGMTIAVVGILGHFPKTLILFFIPQMFNFMYSCPQLFRFVECPRHRMPRVHRQGSSILLQCSNLILDHDRKPIGKIGYAMLAFLNTLGLLKVSARDAKGRILECNNLTLINLVLAYTGPLPENRLTLTILIIQVLCSLLAFYIRYSLVKFVY